MLTHASPVAGVGVAVAVGVVGTTVDVAVRLGDGVAVGTIVGGCIVGDAGTSVGVGVGADWQAVVSTSTTITTMMIVFMLASDLDEQGECVRCSRVTHHVANIRQVEE
jgi:hypothetical protein